MIQFITVLIVNRLVKWPHIIATTTTIATSNLL